MHLTSLHDRFGVEVHGVDLGEVSASSGYGEIRAAFEAHSLLLFRYQHLGDEEQLALGRLFGPLEDRFSLPEPVISPVSNVKDDEILSEEEQHVLHLKANQFWHTDSTFLPVPALINILQARVLPKTGGGTEFVSTRAGFADLEPDLRARLRQMFFRHNYVHSRAKIDPGLAEREMFTKWEDQTWRAIWTNPATGDEALYIASHAFGIVGMEEAEAQSLLAELIDRMTVPEAIYTHDWQPGDVLLWDERATMHRGQAWPYGEARTLVSICVSAREVDGLASIRTG